MESIKTFKLKSTEEFVNFLKRFSPISSTLLIEMSGGYLKAKTHTPEKSVVKFSKIELDKIFDVDDIDEDIMFGVFSIEKLLKAFSHFGNNPNNLDFTIHVGKIQEGNVGTEIFLKNESLSINFQCGNIKLFNIISDEMMESIAEHGHSKVSFILTKEMQSKISSLAGIDSDQKLFSVGTKKGRVMAIGKSFNLALHDTNSSEKIESDEMMSIYKNQFAYLDKEDFMVYMTSDRFVFKSIESDTKMIIGKAE